MGDELLDRSLFTNMSPSLYSRKTQSFPLPTNSTGILSDTKTVSTLIPLSESGI